MSVEIKSDTIDVKGQKITLVSVRGGEEGIGTFTMGANARDGGMASLTKILYVGAEPVVSMICPNGGNKRSDKLMSLCQGFHGYDRKIYDALAVSFTRLNQGDSLTAGLRGIFSLLPDGVYTVYTSDYYPTDGNGAFFWGGYNTMHEVRGTAEVNNAYASGNVFKPCFLIPTQSLDYYSARGFNNALETVGSRLIQGIAYHVSGFHSALLKGHHGSVACVRANVPYKCAVIEKISDPYTERYAPVQSVKNESEDGTAEEQVEEQHIEPQIIEHEGITGFRSPSVKIPIELFPKDMLNIIISSLHEYKPQHFDVITAKLEAVRKKAVTNSVLPLDVLENSEQMPDTGMVESAYAISGLSDEELNCLLAGDVEYNGRVIVSPNFYASIVTACNYLQFTDLKRFVDFSIAIMDNPELSATHEYVAQRVMSQEKNAKLYTFFKSVVESGDMKYEKIINYANTFVERYAKKDRR